MLRQSGDSAVLELSLRYTGAELPALLRPARTSATSTPWPHGRLVTAAIFLLLVAALVEVLFAKSRRIGHFEPLPRQEDIDRGWIEAHILALKPEVVGAAYDRQTGSAEVAALLARLEREGKLATVMTRPDGDAGPERLELELRVGRDELDGYERVLIEKMFVAGERTSAALLQQHYRHFDPSDVLARPLADALRALLGPRAGSDEQLSPTSVVLALVSACALHVSIVGIVMEWSTWWDRDALEVVTALALAICIGLGGLLASFYRQQPEAIDGDPSVRGMFGLFGLMVVVPTLLLDGMTPLELALHFGGGLGIAAFFVWTAWPRDHAAASRCSRSCWRRACTSRRSCRSSNPTSMTAGRRTSSRSI